MHYLKTLLPTLALAASANALVARQPHPESITVKDNARAAVQAGVGPREAGNPPCGQAAPAPAPSTSAAAAAPANATAGRAKAVYFMTNQDDNGVIMLPVQADGLVAEGSIIATGGKGASLIDAKTGQPAASDSLASQAAVRVVGNSLFAVNPGSNSVSMFAIDSANPAKLSAVGQAVPTGGDFPTSIAASSTLNLICVAHTGTAAGISCAKFSPTTGLSAFDALRSFNLNQSSPPTGPLNGIGMTLFNADSTALITTVKGNPMDPAKNTPGFISIYPITPDGQVSTTDTRTTPSGTAVLFGSALVPDSSQILVTDASFGAAVLDLKNLTAPLATAKLADQKATCWAAVSKLTGTGFVTDVGVNHLVEVDLESGQVVAEVQSQNGNPGMIDLQVSGDKVYALAPGNGTTQAAVTVWDVSGGKGKAKEVQNFVVGGAADHRAMGMGVHE